MWCHFRSPPTSHSQTLTRCLARALTCPEFPPSRQEKSGLQCYLFILLRLIFAKVRSSQRDMCVHHKRKPTPISYTKNWTKEILRPQRCAVRKSRGTSPPLTNGGKRKEKGRRSTLRYPLPVRETEFSLNCFMEIGIFLSLFKYYLPQAVLVTSFPRVRLGRKHFIGCWWREMVYWKHATGLISKHNVFVFAQYLCLSLQLPFCWQDIMYAWAGLERISINYLRAANSAPFRLFSLGFPSDDYPLRKYTELISEPFYSNNLRALCEHFIRLT